MSAGLASTAAAGAVGLLAGSFLGVCAERLPQRRSVVSPGSRCPACQRPLSPAENLPLLGYLWLRGRCRACHSPIPIRDLWIEAGAGLAFAWAWFVAGPGIEFVRLAFFLACLLTLAATDIEFRQLPDELTLGGWLAGLALAAWVHPGAFGAAQPGLASALTASFGGAGLLAAVGLGYQRWRGREGLGWGDVKMTGLLGAFLGVQALLTALLLASVAGALVGLGQAGAILLNRRHRGRSWRQARASSAVFLARAALPFGLFLAIGAAAALTAGWRIV